MRKLLGSGLLACGFVAAALAHAKPPGTASSMSSSKSVPPVSSWVATVRPDLAVTLQAGMARRDGQGNVDFVLTVRVTNKGQGAYNRPAATPAFNRLWSVQAKYLGTSHVVVFGRLPDHLAPGQSVAFPRHVYNYINEFPSSRSINVNRFGGYVARISFENGFRDANAGNNVYTLSRAQVERENLLKPGLRIR